MPKFTIGDYIVVTDTLKREKPRLGTVTSEGKGRYIVCWENEEMSTVEYTYTIIDRACRLHTVLDKSNPNMLFKRRKL